MTTSTSNAKYETLVYMLIDDGTSGTSGNFLFYKGDKLLDPKYKDNKYILFNYITTFIDKTNGDDQLLGHILQCYNAIINLMDADGAARDAAINAATTAARDAAIDAATTAANTATASLTSLAASAAKAYVADVKASAVLDAANDTIAVTNANTALDKAHYDRVTAFTAAATATATAAAASNTNDDIKKILRYIDYTNFNIPDIWKDLSTYITKKEIKMNDFDNMLYGTYTLTSPANAQVPAATAAAPAEKILILTILLDNPTIKGYFKENPRINMSEMSEELPQVAQGQAPPAAAPAAPAPEKYSYGTIKEVNQDKITIAYTQTDLNNINNNFMVEESEITNILKTDIFTPFNPFDMFGGNPHHKKRNSQHFSRKNRK